MPTTESLDKLSFEIRGAAITVHRRVGPGCFEDVYIACLAYEFQKLGLDFQRETPLPLRYDDLVVERAYIPDFIVNGCTVVEVKATAPAPIHAVQLQTYLRISGCPLGLLLRFGVERMTDGILRRVNNFPDGTEPGRIPE